VITGWFTRCMSAGLGLSELVVLRKTGVMSTSQLG